MPSYSYIVKGKGKQRHSFTGSRADFEKHLEKKHEGKKLGEDIKVMEQVGSEG